MSMVCLYDLESQPQAESVGILFNINTAMKPTKKSLTYLEVMLIVTSPLNILAYVIR
jgi:hypothetical protein